MDDIKPEGWSTVTPRIFTPDVRELVNFLKTAFNAAGDVNEGRPAEVKIGDSIILISDGGGVRDEPPAFLHLYLEDADAVYKRAIEAGATSVEAPADMPYGDMRATVRDRWGNSWQIATFKGKSGRRSD